MGFERGISAPAYAATAWDGTVAYAKSHFKKWSLKPISVACEKATDSSGSKDFIVCFANNKNGDLFFDISFEKKNGYNDIQAMTLHPDLID